MQPTPNATATALEAFRQGIMKMSDDRLKQHLPSLLAIASITTLCVLASMVFVGWLIYRNRKSIKRFFDA